MLSSHKNIMVTGGLGFIGTNLCLKLIKMGYDVTCIDNKSTCFKGNYNFLKNYQNFSFIEQDICLPLEDSQKKIDIIFHLACPASPPRYQEDPIATAKTCFIGSLNLAEFALKQKSRLVFTSTSEVYGNPLEHPQIETYWGNVNPNGIRSCYDEGKRIAETLLFDFYRQHNLDLKVARIFNTYGPHMDPLDGRVVTNLVVQALKNEELTVYGAGEQTRSFCYVDDMVDGLIKLAESPSSCIGPINLGNPHERTILELASIVKELIPGSGGIKFLPLPKDDPIRRCPDISKAEKLLGWKPEVSLQDGLKKMLSFMQEIIN